MSFCYVVMKKREKEVWQFSDFFTNGHQMAEFFCNLGKKSKIDKNSVGNVIFVIIRFSESCTHQICINKESNDSILSKLRGRKKEN